MALQGALQEVSLPTLIQLLSHEGGQSLLRIQLEDRIGLLGVDNGRLFHASVAQNGRILQEKEEAVYELLKWQAGDFTIDQGQPPPTPNIDKSLYFLLMDSLRRLDEQQDTESTLISHVNPQEETAMASKSEQLKNILDNLVNNSTDIKGAAIVDNDGLLLASAMSGGIDDNRVAAITAGLISLAGRSAQQLQQGQVKQTLIKAENGNIIAVRAGAKASFVALTPTEVNLGMAFLECSDAAQMIESTLT